MTDESEGPLVLSERRGPVLVLTLNRPERLNAWNNDLEDEYFALLDEAERDGDVRAIVLTGAGRGFCAGADMANLQRIDRAAERSERPRTRSFPRSIDTPLIAAINGPAAGLGLVEALFCDLRFTTPEAKLTTSFAPRGLIAEYGLSWILPRLIGTSRALDLLLSGRVVKGEEALAMGLVDRVVPADELLDAAVAYATDLATKCSPASMAIMKRQVLRHAETDFAQAVAESDQLMLESFERPDVKEGVASYMERRAPDFPPLAPPEDRDDLGIPMTSADVAEPREASWTSR
ncbi:enoyl-CoA hydratase-related protein [Patulibacter sp.]|uniref:enoyl-CoA hydratase-related protein n=1 Tax=Patulibacter sp. TaxID=1912859 RepID=UPI002715FD50|nr:enoyl-CoA hydratase-related protein [Patulibacter sp.]MDO9407822.1 enoyl-CoA hydratase-related protein [Patulibacter sp.]